MNTQLDSVADFLEEALAISLALNSPVLEGRTRIKWALYHRTKGENPEALEQAILAQKMADSLRDKPLRILANSALLNSYLTTGDKEKALEIGLKNLALVAADPPSSDKARLHFDVGNIYVDLKAHTAAEKEYKKAIDMCQTIGFVPGEMLMKVKLGILYRNMGVYDKALKQFEITSDYYGKNGQTTREMASLGHLATVYSLKSEHKTSIPLYEKAIVLLDSTKGSLFYKNDLQQKLFIAYSILGDAEKAWKWNDAYVNLKKQIESEDRNKLTAALKVEYETEKLAQEKLLAQTQATLANNRAQANRYYLIAAIGIGASCLVIGLLLFYRFKNAEKIKRIAADLKESQRRLALEKQYKDSELKALKAQMNPHFIFNVLNSIQDYIISNKKNEASDYLGQFADVIRMYLKHSDAGSISLADEMESLGMYLDLEALRFEDNFNYRIHAENSLDTLAIEIPTMLVQPYIENAIKHGLALKTGAKVIEVIFKTENEEQLKCIITDNGIGREKAKIEKQKKGLGHTSFAHRATEERLALLNYGKQRKIGVELHDCIIKGKVSGTEVILTIPITNIG
ncbi:histidine kinase [Sediminicola luteus]|nr:histidine kinase [Sediminicola luteus]